MTLLSHTNYKKEYIQCVIWEIIQKIILKCFFFKKNYSERLGKKKKLISAL